MVRAREYTQYKPDEPRANQSQVARWSSGKRRQPINARCFEAQSRANEAAVNALARL